MSGFHTLTKNYADTAFNTGNNGLLIATIGANWRITGIDLEGLFGQEQVAASGTGNWAESYWQYGVQYGATGYTPVGVVGDPDASNWIFNTSVDTSLGLVSWVSGDTQEIVAGVPFAYQWRGQLPPLAQQSQFYVSNGSWIGSSVTNWKLYFLARIYYS